MCDDEFRLMTIKIGGMSVMGNRLNINTNVLLAYIRQSNIPIEILHEKIKNIDQIISGEIAPTFTQLSNIAKTINVPTGLLLLDKPIDGRKVNLQFRTINSEHMEEMSPELRDTILDMQEKQDFLKEEVESECPFVGLFTVQDDDEKVIQEIHQYLGTKIVKERFKDYRKKMNNLGVFIFLNGKVKDNTRRPLNLKEFRGFVLSDKRAPLIFINQTDSSAGKLFTLIHEFVHLFFDDSDLLTNHDFASHTKLEAKINRITAEILLPQKLLEELLDNQQNLEDNLASISKRFEVSKFVVLRRLYDLKYISREVYISMNHQLEHEFVKLQKNDGNSSGGNYYNNLKFRMDHHFVHYVDNAVKQNRISYTDAFLIVGVGYKGYHNLVGDGA